MAFPRSQDQFRSVLEAQTDQVWACFRENWDQIERIAESGSDGPSDDAMVEAVMGFMISQLHIREFDSRKACDNG